MSPVTWDGITRESTHTPNPEKLTGRGLVEEQLQKQTKGMVTCVMFWRGQRRWGQKSFTRFGNVKVVGDIRKISEVVEAKPG